MRIEANTLQEAFQKAADEFSCSVTELDIKIIQHPRMGIAGFFKKVAIIEAYKEGMKPSRKEVVKPEKVVKKKPKLAQEKTKIVKEKEKNIQAKPVKEQKTQDAEISRRREKTPMANIDEVLPQIQQGVSRLVEDSCFDIKLIKVEKYNEESVLIELDGEDAALLIGKEGYRYKAFSYLLYNWINIKYGFGIRLEIAQFLKNQELMIDKYLSGVIEKINTNGRGQTRPLDGVLIKIALERLRTRFPEKYVGIKTGREGVKFIVVNDFNRK